MRLQTALPFAAAVAAAAAFAFANLRTSPPPVSPTAAPALQQFAAAIDRQYHRCVPLGWFPDPLPRSGYVPGYTAVASDANGVLQALWVGTIRFPSLRDPHAAAVKSVLDSLTRSGLVVRHDIPGGVRYNLTREGARYFYQDNNHGDNVEAWPYLCFSKLHATDVEWTSHAPETRIRYVADSIGRIRFTWVATRDDAWASPFLRAHAVVLDPTSSPAEATVVENRGTWQLADVDFAFPVLEDPSAWTAQPRTAPSVVPPVTDVRARIVAALLTTMIGGLVLVAFARFRRRPVRAR